jgi:hypothetical protein
MLDILLIGHSLLSSVLAASTLRTDYYYMIPDLVLVS